MAHIHGQNQCRNSSKNTRQNLLCAAKPRMELPSFTTLERIAASGINAPVKTWAWVSLVQTSSRRSLKSFRKPDTSDGRRRRSLQLRNVSYAKKNVKRWEASQTMLSGRRPCSLAAMRRVRGIGTGAQFCRLKADSSFSNPSRTAEANSSELRRVRQDRRSRHSPSPAGRRRTMLVSFFFHRWSNG
jgi:hypothetical protein